MSQVTLSVRMDEEVKRLFDSFCAEVGMNASVAVNIFAKTVIRERRIPFAIAADPIEAALDEADAEAARSPPHPDPRGSLLQGKGPDRWRISWPTPPASPGT